MNIGQFSGVLIFSSFILTLYSYFFNSSLLLYASLFFWTAFALFFKTLKNKKLLITLFILGFLCLGISYFNGYAISIKKLLSINQYLLVLLVGVGFLRLIATPKSETSQSLPIGKRAFLKTYFGVHLFGSVINLSSLIIVADKLHKQAKLNSTQLITLTRAFATDAFWSPFFVAFGAALTYAPNLELSVIVINGLALALIAFFFTCKELWSGDYDLEHFRGYPLSFETLYVPILLFILVLTTNYFIQNLKIIVLISFCALILTLIILPIKKGVKEGIDAFSLHVKEELPNMKTEISLFLVAGFFGMSASFLLMGLGIKLPFEVFDWQVASGFLGLFLLLGFVGIHPIITIAILGDLLHDVNDTLLAVSFLIAWSLNVSTSPFSGLNLTISARYDILATKMLKLNSKYTLFMFLVSVCSLYVLDMWLLRS